MARKRSKKYISRKRRLLSHQKGAFAYSLEEEHPALFMEMRLGKTLVAVRRTKMYKPLDPDRGLRVLIVAPSSALGSWEHELELEKETDFVYLMGKREHRLELLEEGHKWNLFNKEGHLALPEIAEEEWDAVILDESTFIKNAKAKVTKFYLRNFRTCPHRWILTGTPNPETDLEFWTQLAFLDSIAFRCRTFWQFRARYFHRPTWSFEWEGRVGTATKVRTLIGERCFVVRRKDVKLDNPKIYEKRKLVFPSKLERVYRKAEDIFILDDLNENEISRTKTSVVTHQWLRQLCGGFLDGVLVWDGKIKEILQLLEGELKNQTMVVWFNYNQEVYAVDKALKKKNITCRTMTGKLSLGMRRKYERDFRADQFQVVLVQQRIAQMGTDFAVADTAIYYSTPVAALARIQTEDRIVSMQKKRPVLYIDLVVEDTVDQDINKALREKKFTSTLTLSRARKYCIERRGLRKE